VRNINAFGNSSQNVGGLTIDKTAAYCIQVVGYLDENWSERLGGLTITSSSLEGGSILTTLSGELVDQAALFGVLVALYDMRYPLLSVKCMQVS
jgi:hypothetical protein